MPDGPTSAPIEPRRSSIEGKRGSAGAVPAQAAPSRRASADGRRGSADNGPVQAGAGDGKGREKSGATSSASERRRRASVEADAAQIAAAAAAKNVVHVKPKGAAVAPHNPIDAAKPAAKAAAPAKTKQVLSYTGEMRKIEMRRNRHKGLWMGIVKRFKRIGDGASDMFCSLMAGVLCGGIAIYKQSMAVARQRELFDSLNLTEREVGMCYLFFRRIDQDDSGSISVNELMDYLKLEKTEFTNRVFSIMDEDGGGTLDFKEFVVAMWSYLTQTKSSLMMFAFDLYDNDGSGQLTLQEIEDMVYGVYGHDAAQNQYAGQIILDLQYRAGSLPGDSIFISLSEFCEFTRSHPAMLMPAFMVQEALRRKVCGTWFWRMATDRRLRTQEGQEYVSYKAMLRDHIRRKAIAGGDDSEKERAAKAKEALDFVQKMGDAGPSPTASPGSTPPASALKKALKVHADAVETKDKDTGGDQKVDKPRRKSTEVPHSKPRAGKMDVEKKAK